MKQNSNLSQIIDCLQQEQKTLQQKSNTSDLSIIHHSTIEIIDKLTQHINRCKKYNQARIHRKYQNTLSYLQEENQSLKAKLELQRAAIPTSHAYVSGLIDKMVEMRIIQQKLIKQNQQLKDYAVGLQAKWENSDFPTTTKNMEQQEQSKSIKNIVSKYLQQKKKQRDSCSRPISNLQKFLQFNSIKVSKWTLRDLLQRLEKWLVNLKDTRLPNSQRIKQRFLRVHTSLQSEQPSEHIRKTDRDTQPNSISKMHTYHMTQRFVPNNHVTALKRKKKNGFSLNVTEIRRQISMRLNNKIKQ